MWIRQGAILDIPVKTVAKEAFVFRHGEGKAVRIKTVPDLSQKRTMVPLERTHTSRTGLLHLEIGGFVLLYQVVDATSYDAIIEGKSSLPVSVDVRDDVRQGIDGLLTEKQFSDGIASVINRTPSNTVNLLFHQMADGKTTVGNLWRRLAKMLPDSNRLSGTSRRDGQPDYIHDRFNHEKSDQIKDLLRAAIQDTLTVRGGIVLSDIPSLEQRLADVLSRSTVDTVRHTVDMRGTDGVPRHFPEHVRLHADDLLEISTSIRRFGEELMGEKMVTYTMQERNDDTGELVPGVLIRCYCQGKPWQSLTTDDEGKAVFSLKRGQKYTFKKSKRGWSFQDEEVIL